MASSHGRRRGKAIGFLLNHHSEEFLLVLDEALDNLVQTRLESRMLRAPRRRRSLVNCGPLGLFLVGNGG